MSAYSWRVGVKGLLQVIYAMQWLHFQTQPSIIETVLWIVIGMVAFDPILDSFSLFGDKIDDSEKRNP